MSEYNIERKTPCCIRLGIGLIMTKPLAIILGPTASGKKAVSVRVAQLLDGEIISGDSMQVYRRMDIGTAKIKPAEMGGVPHHLIDILEPDAGYSVADFRAAARQLIDEITARGKLPIVVGGTGLYISSLTASYHFPEEVGRDDEFRNQLRQRLELEGAEKLHAELAACDPEAAARIHFNDHQRLIRALEVYQQSGQPISEFQRLSREEEAADYNLAICGLTWRRELLYPRIEQRIDAMIAEGLVEEVQALLAAGVPITAQSMQGLGYRQITAYLQGKCSPEEAIETLKRDTRRFAKRQYTWFKRDERIKWYNGEDYLTNNHYPQTEKLADEMATYIQRAIGRSNWE